MKYFFLILSIISVHVSNAQLIKINENDEYTKVLIERVGKFLPDIVDQNDSEKYVSVRNIVIKQYIDLSNLHDKSDADIDKINKDNSLDAFTKKSEIELINLKTEFSVYNLHAQYIGRLNAELLLEQVDEVKNGMTYAIFPNTYQVYLDQNPGMTEIQKQFTYGSLYAARELAMDKGTSDEKHGVFRIYKGIINNYLNGLYDPNDHLTDTAATGIQIITNNNNSIKALVYPNPIEKHLQLKIDTKQEVHSVDLLNQKGQFVNNISNKTLPIGTHNLTFDTSKLANGVYFIRIQSVRETTTIQIIK